MSLTAKQLAALKAGTSVEEVLAMEATPAEVEATTTAAIDAAKATEQPAKEDSAPTVESLQASLVVAQESLTAAQAEKETMTAQLAEANAKVDKLTADHKAAQASSEALAAAVKPYALRMSVALGKSDADVKDLNGVELAQAHAKLASDFSKTFPSGRQSGSTTDADAQKASEQLAVAQMSAAKSLNF